jgi:DNA (cytosine-5)-methyltransferase 1
MGKYSCEKCAKTFSQKSHYDKHLTRKTPCEIQTDKIKALIDKAVEEKLIELNKKLISNNTENNITINITEQMDISKMSKLELLEKCKELGITKCSSKNKSQLIELIHSKQKITDCGLKSEVEINNIYQPQNISSNDIEDDEIVDCEILNKINKKEDHADLNNSENTIKIVSLFAGCGGLDFGFHNNPKYKHVLVNDFDKDACDTYEHNFGIKPICCDVKTLTDIPDFDLLMGGFPCQGFSMANPYRTEADERNKLYLEILRILNQKKPSYFILENVKGILNMGGYDTELDKKNKTGRIVKNIVEDLKMCGYKVQYKLFELKKFNIPQKRERVIFIGVRNDINFEINCPVGNNTELTLKDAIGNLPIDYINEIQHIGTKHKCNVNGFLGNRELKWDEPSPTITGRGGGSGGPVIHNHPSLKRRLTIRECARIQTFPDNFIFKGSVSSMYKQIGNAVPCNFSVYLSKIFN